MITALPTPPSRDDAANFAPRADAFLGSFPLLVAETNQLAIVLNAAAANAVAAAASAVNAPGTSAASATTMLIGAGTRTMGIQPGKALAAGQFVVIAYSPAPAAWMHGQITAHNPDTGSLTVEVGAVAGAGTFDNWTIALTAPIIVTPMASAAQIWAGTETNAALSPVNILAAAASQPLVFAGTTTIDFADGWSRHGTLGGNIVLANPLNARAGVNGRIRLVQDATGGRMVAFGSAWDFPSGVPSLSTPPGTIDALAFYVHAPGAIEATFIKALA